MMECTRNECQVGGERRGVLASYFVDLAVLLLFLSPVFLTDGLEYVIWDLSGV